MSDNKQAAAVAVRPSQSGRYTITGAAAALGIKPKAIRNRQWRGAIKGGVWAYDGASKPCLVAFLDRELAQFAAPSQARESKRRPGLDANGQPLLYTPSGAAKQLGLTYAGIRRLKVNGSLEDGIYADNEAGEIVLVAIPAAEVARLARRPGQRLATRAIFRQRH